ncbi:MAG TPA: ester cyclase [Acidimicrobiales bacterium]|nr:ester cyclase [Acidimicrobiales bacterium]
MADVASIHREMFDVIHHRDFTRLRDLYHPEYTYRGPDGEQGDAEAGAAVAETYLSAFPDLAFTIDHQFSPNESTSVIEMTARGTHQGELEGIAPTGKTVEMLGCNVIEIADGKILREREYFDSMALMVQLGVMEPPGS